MANSRVFIISACCIMFWSAASYGAGPLDQVIKTAETATWGSKSKDVKGKLGAAPLLENKEIIIATSELLGRTATINYMFNKSGALYNVSWYFTTPTTDLDTARKFEQDIETALKAKYGKPARTFTDGGPDQQEEITAEAAKMAKLLAPSVKDRTPTPPDGSRSLTIDKNGDVVMPMVFYSKLNFWKTDKMWVSTNLLCSTDGKCYQHVQFVSKKMTKGEGYENGSPKMFSYTPLDRDQDRATKFNDQMEYARETKAQ